MQVLLKEDVLGRRTGAGRLTCSTCEHIEFVHSDLEARLCLYSECGCSGFMVEAAA